MFGYRICSCHTDVQTYMTCFEEVTNVRQRLQTYVGSNIVFGEAKFSVCLQPIQSEVFLFGHLAKIEI